MISPQNIVVGYAVVAAIVTLIAWWATPKLVVPVFLWFAFAFLLMLLALKNKHYHALMYIAVMAFVPVILLLLFQPEIKWKCGKNH